MQQEVHTAPPVNLNHKSRMRAVLQDKWPAGETVTEQKKF